MKTNPARIAKQASASAVPPQAREKRRSPAPPRRSARRSAVPETDRPGSAPQFPNGSGIAPTLVKRPRDDGKPGLQWEGDVEVVEAAEALECVACDSNATLPTALYERPNGSLVLLNEYIGRGVNQWKDISFSEALDWVRNFMAPLEVCGRFGETVASLCLKRAPKLGIIELENSLNKAAALLDLFSDAISDGDDRGEQFNGGCVTLSAEAANDLKEVLEMVCNYQTEVRQLLVSDSNLNPGWKQLGPILNLAEAA